MELHNLPQIKDEKSKRLGRGHGSGRGKTAGRGTKGQKARTDISLSFEGGALPLIKRMPFLRGKGRNRVFAVKPTEVTLTQLSVLPAKSIVTVELLVKEQIVKKGTEAVKVIATGTLSTALTVKVQATKGAQALIEKAGGTVEQ